MSIQEIEQRPTKLISQDEMSLIVQICGKWRAESTESLLKFVQNQAPCKTSKSGEPLAYEAVLNQPVDSLY